MTNPARSGDAPYPIRPVSSDEFDGFEAVAMHAFHGSPLSVADRELVLARLEFDRNLAAFDGPAQVGTAGAYSFQLSVPGARTLPAAGVTWVGVLPSHRRRGVLSSLMRRQLADVRDRGEPVAVLWASEAIIYSRYGYGRANWHADLTLYRGEGALARHAPADGGLRLRLVDPAAATTHKKIRSARGHSSRPPARMGKIITPGENHHTETCTAATAMAIAATESANASRRFLVMNCLVSWVRRAPRADRARCGPRRGGFTMMRVR